MRIESTARIVAAALGVAMAVALSSGAGCGKRPLAPDSETGVGKDAKPLSVQRGKATYYARRFHGRKTASGERYDRTEMTAAHRTLPFGSIVRVTNLENDRQVLVRINDRGPFSRGRVIDLSEAAAKEIDMIRAGVVKVRVEVMSKPDKERH